MYINVVKNDYISYIIMYNNVVHMIIYNKIGGPTTTHHENYQS